MNRKSRVLPLRPHGYRRRSWQWYLLAAASLVLVASLAVAARRAGYSLRPDSVEIEHLYSIAVSADGQRVYGATPGGLLVTADYGGRWRRAPALSREEVHGIVFAPSDLEQAYLTGHTLGVYASRDGGRHFAPVPGALPGADVHALAVSPRAAEQVWVWVVGHGLYGSADGGAAWQPLAREIGLSDVYALAVTPAGLLAGGQEGLASSADGGRTWERIPGVTTAVYGLAARGNQVYAAAGTGCVLFSRDGGARFAAGSCPGTVMMTAVAFYPPDPGLVLAASDLGRMYRSQDGGESWGLLH